MILQANRITHYYQNDLALEEVNFSAQKGAFIALVGESGSGKSTLLGILSSLLKPTKGDVLFEGKKYDDMTDMDAFRQNEVGFIFQFHYLISYLNIEENIAFAMKTPNAHTMQKLLCLCGIDGIKHKYPDEISGGQRQRAAIVRALINHPKIIFADEPTGNLDSRNSQTVYELFQTLSKEGTTIIVATHDTKLARFADTIFEVKDGKIL